MTNNESKGPFEGLLVIDMTHVLNDLSELNFFVIWAQG